MYPVCLLHDSFRKLDIENVCISCLFSFKIVLLNPFINIKSITYNSLSGVVVKQKKFNSIRKILLTMWSKNAQTGIHGQ